MINQLQEQINAMNESRASATMRADEDPLEDEDDSSDPDSVPQVIFDPHSPMQTNPARRCYMRLGLLAAVAGALVSVKKLTAGAA